FGGAQVRLKLRFQVVPVVQADLKSQFEPDLGTAEFGDPDLRRLQSSAYAQWKAWERDNPDIAAKLREEAELRAAEAVRPGF
ncbi:MAG: hypothetical protein AAGK93_09635, partial [Pseudomonadota bacterium]